MPTSIGMDYSRFYKGSEALECYGSGELMLKDTIVRYEFNTVDEQGNKIMDKMTREETLRVMKEISARYGDNVLVEFSGDGMAALVEAKKGQLDRPLTEEEMAAKAKRQEAFDNSVVHLENTHRLIIPNIQTNDKLVKGLGGADKETVDAAYGIIKNYLLKSNTEGMSEKERQDMIAFGLEGAKYLAVNYMDEAYSNLFMDAMETIAKYGMNGKVSGDGKVTYHIEWGPLAGAPDDYVHENDIIREKAPDLYRQIAELNERIRKGETGWSRQFLELQKKVQAVLGAASGVRSSDGKMLSNSEAAAKKYSDWKRKIKDTKLPAVFSGVKYNDLSTFFESLRGKSSLSDDWLTAGMDKFRGWLGFSDYKSGL